MVYSTTLSSGNHMPGSCRTPSRAFSVFVAVAANDLSGTGMMFLRVAKYLPDRKALLLDFDQCIIPSSESSAMAGVSTMSSHFKIAAVEET